MLQLDNPAFDYVLYPSKRGWKTQTKIVEAVSPAYTCKRIGTKRLLFDFAQNERPAQVQEYFLQFDYTGDVALAFQQGGLVLDHFYHGIPWRIGLNRFSEALRHEAMLFYIRPIYSNATYLQDLPQSAIPTFTNGAACSINEMKVIPQYGIDLKLKD